MTFNLDALQQIAERTLHNADEFVRKWIEFLSAPAGTLTLEYYDQSGNLRSVSFSNRAKIVRDFVTNVKSALIKRFYLDANSGNNSNDGSYNSPLKDLDYAIEIAPPGVIELILNPGNYVITRHQLVENKLVKIKCSSGNPQDCVISHRKHSDGYLTGLRLRNSAVAVYYCTIKTCENVCNTNANYIKSIFGRANDTGFGILQLYDSNLLLNDGDLFSVSFGGGFGIVLLSDVKITLNGEGKILRIEDAVQSAVLNVYHTNLPSGVQWSDLIAGIVRDSNDVPRNIISNLVL